MRGQTCQRQSWGLSSRSGKPHKAWVSLAKGLVILEGQAPLRSYPPPPQAKPQREEVSTA